MENKPQKKIRGNVVKELDTEECAKTSEKCLSQHLTYDVLRIIFKYLNAMELSNASMVCRSWLEAANNEKRTRGPVCSKDYKLCFVHQNQSVEYVKSQIIKQLRIKPALGLFFTSSSLPYIKEDCHCKVLPTNCPTITLATYGIVVDNNEKEENQNYLVWAFLPEMPNVSIKTFSIAREDRRSCKTIEDLAKSVKQFTEGIRESLNVSIKNNHRSKCLLLFCNLKGFKLAIQIANSLTGCFKAKELSVWGGVAEDLLICNAGDSKNDRCGEFAVCVGITLTGSIDTWSVIVDRNCKTEERVEQRLKSLKSQVCLKKHSIGFMFACSARGSRMFNERNVESSVFKKLFPEVPLVGCIGDGEFGENSISNEPTGKKQNWSNQVTTVFLIVTYS